MLVLIDDMGSKELRAVGPHLLARRGLVLAYLLPYAAVWIIDHESPAERSMRPNLMVAHNTQYTDYGTAPSW